MYRLVKAKTSPLNLGKHLEEPQTGDCLDRISSLPDDLLGHILSFLPTWRAVSTSILSTRWRYLFTLTTCLSFDDEFYSYYNDLEEIVAARKIMFRKFVYKVLELHQISPIEKFSLICGGTYDELDLNAWVCNAVLKGVQELYYMVREQKNVLPDGLFMCETLVRLKMIGYRHHEMEIPLSAWLPRLKILHLESVIFFNYDSVKRLFSGCELLEELTLKYCECDSGGEAIISIGLLKVLTMEHCSFELGLFEIDAPNLAYLIYSTNTGVKIVPSRKDLCSLVKAELEFDYDAEDDYDFNSLDYDCGLLKAAAYKATELHLSSDSVEELLPTLADHEQMPEFQNLSRLHLGHCPPDAWKYVTSVLDKSPVLETVIFEWGLHCCDSDQATLPDDPLIPFSCHVKEIRVLNYCGHEGSVLLLGHLLRNAGVLRTLIVRRRRSFNIEEERRISKDLLMLPRASRDCCIELQYI